jgi:UDP-N-acetylglucosamine--N-acetylmuramyl-(pentapeptide) pyrophosphoryl-undecaprenol N-acetylglucosamine transferase
VVVFVAWLYRIPIFVHESDSVPGLSTKFSVPFASKIGVSFRKTFDFISSQKVILVGNPIRPELLEIDPEMTKEKAKIMFGFDPLVPLILVIGGSQGSVRINEFMIDNAKELVSKYQILHQVGPQNFEGFKNELAVATKDFIPADRNRYKIVNFLQKEIREAYLAADIVVSRAGSGAIFEIAAFKKPSILIPLESAASDHQRLNAYEYAKNGACVVIEEDNLKPALFFTQIDIILNNKNKYQIMSQAAEKFAKPQASEIIAQEIINLAL